MILENSNWIKRVKWPELYKAEPYRDVNGDLIFTRLSEEKKMTQTSGSSGSEMSSSNGNYIIIVDLRIIM